MTTTAVSTQSKVLHPFDVEFQGKYFPVFIKVEFGGQHYRKDGGYFSVSGTEGPMKSGNAKGGSGQIDMGYQHREAKDDDKRYAWRELKKPSDLRFAKGWTKGMWFDLLDIWKQWHLKEIAEVPAHVIDSVQQLPDTDRVPNWV